MASLGCGGEMCAIAASMPPHTCPRQGRWRPTPSVYAIGAGDVTTV